MSFDSGPDSKAIGHGRHGIPGHCYLKKRAEVAPVGGNAAKSGPRTGQVAGKDESNVS